MNELTGFILWLSERSWLTGADHAKQMYLVREYVKETKPKWQKGE